MKRKGPARQTPDSGAPLELPLQAIMDFRVLPKLIISEAHTLTTALCCLLPWRVKGSTCTVHSLPLKKFV